jgi:hypothetical protein
MAYIKLDFDDAAEVGSFHTDGGSYLVRATQPDGQTAIVFSAVLNEDIDGAPNCYARFNPAAPHALNGGLDLLRNATNFADSTDFSPLPKGVLHHAWRWVGVLHKTHTEAVAQGVLGLLDERPELAALNENGNQRSDPQFPVLRDDNQNFYVSKTSIPNNVAAATTNPAHWWDATAVAYAALTPPMRNLGVDFGDFGVAIRRDTGVSSSFLYADGGNGNKVGEVSRTLFRTLVPDGNQEEHLVAFIVFPGSRLHPVANNPSPTIRSRLADLSSAANVGTLIGLMASASPYRGLLANEEVWVIDDMKHFLRHRAPDLDVYARPAADGTTRFRTIANALQPYGFNAATAVAAAREAAEAERPGLRIPEPMDLKGLTIPAPPGV